MQQSFLRAVALAAPLVLVVSACRSATAPQELTGRYLLSAVNQRAVPFLVGPTPRTPNIDTGETCQLTISTGALTLTEETQRFVLTYTLTNSCNPSRPYATSTEIGTYTRRGRTIAFRVFDGEQDVQFDGTASDDRIDVTGTPYAFSFTR